ncbi:hypothetical protein SELMODRAFT_437729 [Selaginella moellendorffii]|uniref:Peroxisome biogenesis protein 12 n=1 Tax=Selaginella moellendorffii TaxID=88036 RepID=D8QP62_SELML|nr:peroxisome biogenesis protein 12 [Selaginella moellendorffii]XP_024529416.1 peroxisome biogenesis protein 12 [Selaginella moellendorffii]EFJ38878.1 hypothetical protein SELMODRAFT_437729 [Selaginella moellendorffii]|eukprot:XP_024529412.1 peroxisome biogenesis protein 12 [Selaginella moellendorffii]
MLMQVGGEGDRPTFFEMVAAQQLPESLRAALMYSLGVIAQRRPIVHRVLDYSDEFFAFLMLILEAHNVRTADASFAEALYGLRRQPVEIVTDVTQKKSSLPSRAGLTRAQKSLSIFFLVGLPYIKAKLQGAYTAQRGSALQTALWGSSSAPVEEVVPHNNRSIFQRWKLNLVAFLTYSFPWIHATHEGLSFAYQLLYLLEATRFYSPALYLTGVYVRRASGQELLDGTKHIQERRNHDYERIRGPASLKAVQRGLLKSLYTFLDYAQTGLIAGVFLFKMMEWWYQSAEERVMAPTIYPPPPPPPPPKVAPNGIPLPESVRTCPLCLQRRTNPAMAAVSGYVFCYPCIYKYISQYKRCPVTLIPADIEHIRRLYKDA